MPDDQDDEKAREIVKEMEQKLNEIDDKALQGKENWWVLILEDKMIML